MRQASTRMLPPRDIAEHPSRETPRDKSHHILGTSANLLGICFVIITALNVTHISDTTLADEISMGASVEFITACVLSYLSLRSPKQWLVYERLADYLFLLGLFTLLVAMLSFYAGF
jgi:hypothetical protein